VREIARGAGVTAMLVNRYFGSKERLFAEVVAETMRTPVILTEEFVSSGMPGDAFASALVELTEPGATPLDGFLIMVHSASSKRAAENRPRADRTTSSKRRWPPLYKGTWRLSAPLLRSPWSPASRSCDK